MKETLIKCRYCDCSFLSRIDYEKHVNIHWKKAKNGKGEWMSCELDSYLTTRIRNSGPLIIRGYRYSLVNNSILYRTKMIRS